ncbi:MAG TPA: SDR family oxidoreductase [Candidatus Angelobacter sp.]|jgi:3-oxoacyl-[acyl-carrier protein] reductase|nr:SDR family oxidoreductase [Candidatus Angelobacter sp.]
MDLGLRGRAAFVAASSKGIGLAIAHAFAAEGADVAMCARNATELSTAAESVRAHGTRVVAHAADLADASAVRSVVASAAAELGRLDILLVNAGGPPPGVFEQLSDDAWSAAHDLTLMSAVRLVRESLPHLRASDSASIVFISSYSVRQPIAGLTLSNSVRLGVSGLAKSLSFELAPHIRVNTILPGMIATGRSIQLAAARLTPGRTVEQVMAESAAAVPLGRYAHPDELARAAVFVASPAASYVNGATIPVDGGLIRATL